MGSSVGVVVAVISVFSEASPTAARFSSSAMARETSETLGWPASDYFVHSSPGALLANRQAQWRGALPAAVRAAVCDCAGGVGSLPEARLDWRMCSVVSCRRSERVVKRSDWPGWICGRCVSDTERKFDVAEGLKPDADSRDRVPWLGGRQKDWNGGRAGEGM